MKLRTTGKNNKQHNNKILIHLKKMSNTKCNECIVFRSGRMGNEWKDMSEEQQSSIMEQARAWMEILPSNGNVEATTVEVGEPTMLLIKSTLPGLNN